ncbi:MAG: hypothetical protein COA79_22525 [Planctomycetota bacterium]|nr:MAG: hypothetical protein COA79_22525 [Planctomycetota bacterium]
MTIITPDELERQVYEASKLAFSYLLHANPEEKFYTFALWTDDSLQFLNPVANTEDGLDRTVQRYRKEVDPKYNTTSTHDGMRWSYGDWVFFPDIGEEQFADINDSLNSIFNLDMTDDEYDEIMEPLWVAIIKGFARLDSDGFFGADEGRHKITLLIVGDLPEELLYDCAKNLNPTVIADEYINWTAE